MNNKEQGEQCNCEEMSCKVGCTKNHTYKGFSCEKCTPFPIGGEKTWLHENDDSECLRCKKLGNNHYNKFVFKCKTLVGENNFHCKACGDYWSISSHRSSEAENSWEERAVKIFHSFNPVAFPNERKLTANEEMHLMGFIAFIKEVESAAEQRGYELGKKEAVEAILKLAKDEHYVHIYDIKSYQSKEGLI